METKYTREEDCSESVTCIYSVEEVNQAFEKAIKIYSSSLQMDGFRKGKVPSSIVEQRVGADLLYKVIEILSRNVYDEVTKAKGVFLSSGISPRPESGDDIDLPKKNASYTITYTYTSIPEIELPEILYEERELNVEPITEEELEKAIYEFVKQSAPLNASENSTPKDNDIAVLSITIKEGDKLIGEQSEYNFTLPNDTFLRELEDTIRAMEKGSSKEIEFTFSEATGLENTSIVSGKTCNISLTLHDIKTVPVLSDNSELLKAMGYELFADFKDAYKKLLLEYKTASAKTDLQREIISSVAQRVDCEIPSILIELYNDAVLENFESMVNAQGFTINLFASEFRHIGKMAEEVARDMAKNQVILINIAHKEGLSVSDTEFAAFIQQLAQQSGVDPMKLYEEYRENDMLLVLYQRLLADKTSLFVYKQAVEGDKAQEKTTESVEKTSKKETKSKKSKKEE